MDTAALRAEFPVLDRFTYLNAGTAGPWPHAASVALRESVEAGERDGRLLEWFMGGRDLGERLRAAYAALLGAPSEEVALTSCTSDGIARVLGGLELTPGDEIITSEGEHPGLLGPLAAAIAQRGVTVREVPFARVADEVGAKTKLVACSHVHWATGELAPEALAGLDVPVLLDGAQGVGAVPVRVRELGCAFYAGSGQKWLCGPVGTGMLWIAPDRREQVAPVGATYINLAEPARGLESAVHGDARSHDSPALSAEASAASLAAHDVLAAAGWDAVYTRARTLAEILADRLRERGRTVAPRDETTLVSWEDDDPEATRDRLAGAGVLVRNLPGTPYLRASVGAWNDERDLDRLLEVATGR